ncbi:hypothetical protein ABFB09_01000 [Dehalogenimonas sp. THU2]|uniref:hypothetical protein n=1 Tax=Dehalogenimonas sp. THU2 TaxID=3151121 RepID=UPI003218A3C3
MKIGPGELLMVALIIILFIGASRMKKVSQDVKKQNEAARPVRRTNGAAVKKPAVKYPQLQLLGVLVLLAGATMAVIGYLISQGFTTLFVGGVIVAVIGIAFMILARRR